MLLAASLHQDKIIGPGGNLPRIFNVSLVQLGTLKCNIIDFRPLKDY